MAELARVEWLGDEILLKVAKSTMAAIDEITHAAADDAAKNHWWSNRTGDLEKNTFAAPATFDGVSITGKFGSSMRKAGFYGLFLERQTPWLRPAADRHFRELGAKIGVMLRWT